MAITHKTEWRFDAEGQPADYPQATSAIRVQGMTQAQAIALAETLRPQVAALYTPVIDAIANAYVTAAAIVEGIFATEEDGDSKSQDPNADTRSLVFLVNWESGSGDNADALKPKQLVGFSRVFHDASFGTVVGAPLIADASLAQSQQEAVQRALFHATQVAGEALAQSLLAEKRAKAISDVNKKLVPESNKFLRGMFAATDFVKTLLAENGFADEKSRVELAMDLDRARRETQDPVVFSDGLTVKPLDLNDAKQLVAVFSLIKMAFGSSPPSFEAWKSHYAQQPRFAPELSFAVWDEGGEPVAAVVIERIVEGEGGGENEIQLVYTTDAKLQTAAAATTTAETKSVDDDLQTQQRGDDEGKLAFTGDFDARKERITREATQAYVCGAATKAEYRGKGLASGLLQMAFREAMKTPLQEVVLATDTMNESALRAYARAGMVETKSFSSGWTMTKQIPFTHQQ